MVSQVDNVYTLLIAYNCNFSLQKKKKKKKKKKNNKKKKNKNKNINKLLSSMIMFFLPRVRI